MSDSGFTYVGSELEIFFEAFEWKRYWASQLRPYIHGHVLEVGAGIGANTQYLIQDDGQWTSLEPDPDLVRRMRKSLPVMADRTLEIRQGTIADLEPTERFDTILYIDVLEHVEDDESEFQHAAQHLRPGGHLVVLAPAHQSLFSEFDKSVGHYRRYSAGDFRSQLRDPTLELVQTRYLDSAGLVLSLANRALLRQSLPTKGQIRVWNRVVVPISRVLDPLSRYRYGKTVVGMWRRVK